MEFCIVQLECKQTFTIFSPPFVKSFVKLKEVLHCLARIFGGFFLLKLVGTASMLAFGFSRAWNLTKDHQSFFKMAKASL